MGVTVSFDATSLLLGFLLALVLALVAHLILRGGWQRQLQEQGIRREEGQRREQELNTRLLEATRTGDELRTRMDAERQRTTGLEKELEVERARLQERITALQQAEERLKESFSDLSRSALEANARSFLTLAEQQLKGSQGEAVKELENRRQAVDALVKPIADTMRKLEEQLQQAERRSEGAGASLRTQLELMGQGQRELAAETDRLRRALRQPTGRGRWGEMQLKRVAELAGMLDHCDFHEQQGVTSDEGTQGRPDMVIHLPGGKSLAVDAKAVMDAYLEAMDAQSEDERQIQMARHARQVKDHINKLSARTYWNSLEHSPEFVVMFIPGEAFYSAALQADPGLLEYGSDKRVILAGPTTLLALLKATSYGWQQEVITENARRVSQTGKELYERLVTFAGHFARVRKGLLSAVEGYNSAAGSFESRVLVSARRIEELGIPVKESLASMEPIDTQPRELIMPQSSNIGLPGEIPDNPEPEPEPIP
jgi:DNA recombination protein RmuC